MAGDRVRDEAERLVAAAIAAVTLAARGMGSASRGPIATGSPECCVCPVCRVISTMRDPSADLAERLASGAGDLATGVASMLRALARGSGSDDGARDDRTQEGDEFWESLRRRAADEATSHRSSGPGTTAAGDWSGESEEDGADPWRTATTANVTTPRPPAKPMAKKAVKKAVPVVVEEPSPPAKKATAKKAAPPVKKTAKKAVKKAVPPPEEFG